MSDNKPEDGNGGEDLKETPKKKDRWDKASIILKPIGGLLTALAIVFLGFLTQQWLENTQKRNRDSQLYTELMSKREDSENTLRAKMFEKILDILTKPGEKKNPRKETEEDKLKRVRNKILNLELITRNFHEFLDVRPIFLDLLLETVRRKSKCPKTSGNPLSPCEERESRWRSGRQRLISMAQRVRNKQLEVLKEFGDHACWVVPLSLCCCDENERDLKPEDHCWNAGFEGKAELKLTSRQRVNGNIQDTPFKRKFKIFVNRAYPKWGMLRVKVTAARSAPDGLDPDTDTAEFWIGSFDFPLVDNTYLSAEERFAVTLEYCARACGETDKKECKGYDSKYEKQQPTCPTGNRSADRSDKKGKYNNERCEEFRGKFAKIHLVYFPASAAGLKERSFYHQKVIQQLIEESDVISRWRRKEVRERPSYKTISVKPAESSLNP